MKISSFPFHLSSLIFHLSSFPIIVFTHDHWMRQALVEARKAYDLDEVPIGCVIVQNEKVIAKGHNLTEQLKDATAHAEMMAITAASAALESRYLTECTLYVT